MVDNEKMAESMRPKPASPEPRRLAFKPRADLTMAEFAQILTALTVVIDGRIADRMDKRLLRHFEEKVQD